MSSDSAARSLRPPLRVSANLLIVIALGASLTAHLAIMLIPAGSGALRTATHKSILLSDRLVATLSPSAMEIAPELGQIPVLPLERIAPSRLAPIPTTVHARTQEQAPSLEAGVSIPQIGTARPLAAFARLGPLLDRWQSEFPMEVEMPVRVYGKLEVSYPPAALEKHIEGTAVAWAIVHPDGVVEDVQVVEGDDVFRDAIVAAIQNARYYPAANRGKNISYPIALEFTFSLRNVSNTAGGSTLPAK